MTASRSSWRRWLPWSGKPSPADAILLAGIASVVLLGVVVRPLTPFLIANHPLLLEVLTGDLFAVGIGAANARIGVVPLWAAVAAGTFGMIKFDWLTWWAGRQWGEGFLRTVSTPEQARRWTGRVRSLHPWVMRGAVVFAMLPGVPSAAVFAAAGMTGMRLRTFLLLDAAGSLLVTGVVSVLGYRVGQQAVDVALLIDEYATACSIALLVAAVTVPLVRRWLRRKN